MSRRHELRAATFAAILTLAACGDTAKPEQMAGIRVMQRSARTAAPRPPGGRGGAAAEAGRSGESRSASPAAEGAAGEAAADGGEGGRSPSVQAGAGGGAPPPRAGAGAGGASGKGAAGRAGSAAGAAAGSGAGASAGAAGVASVPASDRGQYFVSGTWHGYVWTAQHGEGTTLSPLDFNAQTTGMPRCISGEVAPTPDNSGSAMLGVNLNQATPPDAPVLTVAPTKAGVRVGVTNKAGSPLRLQIQALDGATNDLARWCANVEGSGGFLPWSKFNTTCWDGAGRTYDGEPLSAAMILVPGMMDAPVPYDFCLNTLIEADSSED